MWRCNTGFAWGGEFVKPGDSFRIFGFKIRFPVLKNLRKIELWPVGSPDLIGFDSVLITRDMVPPEGLRVAVFTACELKAGRDQLRKEQINWRNLVVRMGGVHREVRDDCVIENGFMRSS